MVFLFIKKDDIIILVKEEKIFLHDTKRTNQKNSRSGTSGQRLRDFSGLQEMAGVCGAKGESEIYCRELC